LPLFPPTTFEAFPAVDIILGDILGDGNFVTGRDVGGNDDGDDVDDGDGRDEDEDEDEDEDPFVVEREGEDSVDLSQLMVGGRFDLREGPREDEGEDEDEGEEGEDEEEDEEDEEEDDGETERAEEELLVFARNPELYRRSFGFDAEEGEEGRREGGEEESSMVCFLF